MIITISGTAGSGKSTLARQLADELGFERIYVGGIRRQMAKERGMTLAEFNELGETDPSTDVDVDKRVMDQVRGMDDVIVESRVMYHFLPESIKIFVTCDLDVAAQRIFKNLSEEERNEDKGLETIEDVKQSIIERETSDKKRYRKYYNIDAFDPKNYDLVIDSTDKTPEDALKIALDYINSKK